MQSYYITGWIKSVNKDGAWFGNCPSQSVVRWWRNGLGQVFLIWN